MQKAQGEEDTADAAIDGERWCFGVFFDSEPFFLLLRIFLGLRYASVLAHVG